ncbi:hypothetical protein BD779DRAFT_1479394 [Infundibulicybe gibba]|nr:hypothetical protein BD779DRAFT_1479394 [Infundibulicybe gibba]
MYPSIPVGSPPPTYENPPEYEILEVTDPVPLPRPPPSPTLSELEVEVYGARLVGAPSRRTPPNATLIGPPHTPIIPLQSSLQLVGAPSTYTPPDATPIGPPHTPVIPSQSSSRLTLRIGPRRAPSAVNPPPSLHTPPPSSLPDTGTPSEASTEFEILVWVTRPDKKLPSGRGKKKVQKVEPSTHGPVTSTTGNAWDELLEILAELLETEPTMLDRSSMEWRWLKPTNSQWLPLRSNTAYRSLLKQLKTPPRGASAAYIIIRMAEPARKPSNPSMPWSQAGASAGSSSAQAAEPDELIDSDDDGSRKRKQPSLDNQLADIVTEIEAKYPVGACPIHPDKECIHHRPSDLHFELTRTRKLAWAAKKRSGTATMLAPPVGSNFFKKDDALKVPSSALAPATAPPSIPVANPTVHAQPAGLQPATPPQNQFPGPFGMAYPPFPNTPLDDTVKGRLEQLGFQVGDNLTQLDATHWKAYSWFLIRTHYSVPSVAIIIYSTFNVQWSPTNILSDRTNLWPSRLLHEHMLQAGQVQNENTAILGNGLI